MSRTLFPTALAALLLAGCATDQAGLQVNRSLYPRHQPVVQRADYMLDLDASGGSIAGPEQVRLARWLDALALAYGDKVYVDGGAANQSARDAVAEVVGRYGLLIDPDSPVVPAEIPYGMVRVIVSRTTASVPGCPDWSQAGNIGAPISTASNFGCATNANLAAMIADPNDLVLGQSAAPGGDPAAANKAVRVYRDRVPTGVDGKVKAESTGGSN